MRLPDQTQFLHFAARLVLIWENAWRALLPLLCLVGLFLALALLQLPALLSPWLHVVMLGGFALLAAAAVWFAVSQWRRPSNDNIVRRLETDSGLHHRPLSSLADRLTNAHDHQAAALWRAHLRQTRETVRDLRVGLPRPGLPKVDPWSFRALVFCCWQRGCLSVGWRRRNVWTWR
jgi:hypothetical protein